MSGWIKLHRKLQNNTLWKSEKFTRGQAWVDLLILANHKDGFVFKRGVKVELKRGDIGHSEDTLTKRWKWSKGKVRRFLALLVDSNMVLKIDTGKTSVNTCIRIINYNQYQGDSTEDSTENSTEDSTEDGNGTRMIKKKEEVYTSSALDEVDVVETYISKKGKILKNRTLSDFNLFWESFDYKSGKAEAADAWIKVYNKDNLESIIEGAKKEAKRRPGLIEKDKTPKMAQGWLNGRRWEDEIIVDGIQNCSVCDYRVRGVCNKQKDDCGSFIKFNES